MNVLLFAENNAIPGTNAWDLLRVLFVLALVVGLIIVLLRYFAKRNRGWWMNRSLRSLGGLPLGTNKSLQVVEWNGRIYVLGVGENVTLLDSITDADLAASLLADYETAPSSAVPALPEWLRKWSRRASGQGNDGQVPDSESRPNFEQALENRLRELAERRQRVEKLLEERPSGDRSDNP
ncbi:flagellar protein [Cohnella pontilimi]|uniref:Flagellar protein n=1 Tax=Cohnella pontilimi TaxID=2564100 RepID=A0A4U0FED0_9BACL|nr:flagellar biosynthetic protein FliO [Cohnella pontilimi]TJY43177.1 flagellar protein [Cohnella pontilimi]